MARRIAIPSKRLALKIVGPRDAFLASRIQRAEVSSNTPSTDIDELGNPLHAGTVEDIPTVSLPFSAFDTGIKVFSTLTGTDPSAYPGAGVDIGELGNIDAVIYIREDSVATYAKSVHAKKLRIQDFTFSYSVDGEGTEDYTATGTERRYFKYNVVVEKFTSGTTSFVLADTPVTLKNGDKCLSVILDGEYLEEVASSPATGQYSVATATITTFDSRVSQLIAVYHEASGGDTWTDVSDSTMPPAIQGKDIEIEISANLIPRVQSITINGNLNVTEVREMGNDKLVGYQSQVPSVEGSFTVLDTDEELIDLLTYGSISSGNTEFALNEYEDTAELPLEIQLTNPASGSQILKTIYIPTIKIVGDSYTANVNDNAVQVFNFKSTTGACIVYSGARV
jgi:hypothetical protein